MKNVQIVKAFTLTHDDGSLERFNPGVYELEDNIAEHWYVVAHSNNPGPFRPAAGTPEYAKEEARKAARRKVLDAAIEEVAEVEAAETMKAENEGHRRRIIKDANSATKTVEATKNAET